jgi:hypothetical protein
MIILALALLAADLSIRVAPEPLAITRTRYGHVREMGTWRVAVCSEAREPLTVDALRIEMAIQHLSLIDPEAAADVLRLRGDERARLKWAKALGALAVAGTALAAGGYVQVSGRAAGMIGLGIEAAGRLRGRIESEVIIFDPSKLLAGQIELEPGECTSRVAFAALVPRSQLSARVYRLTVPEWRRRPATKGITSIP